MSVKSIGQIEEKWEFLVKLVQTKQVDASIDLKYIFIRHAPKIKMKNKVKPVIYYNINFAKD
jgi:hypothetical protein